MTKGQQIVLIILLIMVLGVIGLLAFTLINTDDAASPAPTRAVGHTPTPLPTWHRFYTATPTVLQATWTSEATRTPPATDTPRPTRTATPLPSITPTFAPTYTPLAPVTPAGPAPTATLDLENPGFEGIRGNTIPGWSWWAEDNFTPGGDYDPDTSFETPLFKQADDRARFISGPTLQIDAVQHLKFKVHIFQTVFVTPTATVDFRIMAGAFSDSGYIQMAAGIDAAGGSDCADAEWSEIVSLNQQSGAQTIAAPQVTAGDEGWITVCLFAEPQYPAISNAAFFDDAELMVNP